MKEAKNPKEATTKESLLLRLNPAEVGTVGLLLLDEGGRREPVWAWGALAGAST